MWKKTKIKACHPEPCQPLAKAFVHGPLWQGVRIPSLGTSGVPRGLSKKFFHPSSLITPNPIPPPPCPAVSVREAY